MGCLIFVSSFFIAWYRERGALRAVTCCLCVYSGDPGHCDEGRSLEPHRHSSCGCPATSSCLHVFVAPPFIRLLADAASISTRRRQGSRSTQVSPMSIGAPAWLLQWLLAPRRVGKLTAWDECHLFARAGSAPWMHSRPSRRPSLRCSCKI